jgi:hypothetical protein
MNECFPGGGRRRGRRQNQIIAQSEGLENRACPRDVRGKPWASIPVYGRIARRTSSFELAGALNKMCVADCRQTFYNWPWVATPAKDSRGFGRRMNRCG